MSMQDVAIQNLRPNAEWVMYGDDVENIIWHTPNVQPLTKAEVDAEVARLEAEAQVAADAREAARVAAVAHAQSLGFTGEMIAAMGLGG